MSKQDFDVVCQQYLPSIVDRVVSLRLSNSDVTPGLPSFFLSCGFKLTQFIHLRSITLNNIKNDDTVTMLNEIHHLKHLIYLNIINCSIPRQNENISYFWNQIWALPKLKHLVLTPFYDYDIDLSRITVTSPALENLSITTTNGSLFRSMVYIFQYTPHLRILSIKIRCENANEINPIAFPSITTLKLVFRGTPHALNNLFQNMPNLCCLIIEMQDCYLTGHEWKQILINNLPKIKLLRFKMYISLFSINDKEKRVDEVIDTFRTSFWLDERKWFVRCDWNPGHGPISNSLYTLPYAFDTFTGISNGRSKWTSPDDRREHWLFKGVRIFMCKTLTDKKHLDLHPIRFSKIQELVISYPVHEHIWYTIPTFDYLISLRMFMYGDRTETDLQNLFNQAPHLYELIVADSFKGDFLTLSRLRSTSIRRLYFYVSDRDFAPAYILDDDDCAIFAKSSLGRQCEVLSGIHVKSPTHVLYIVNNMNNLRALTVTCKIENSLTTRAEFVEWLHNHLPPKCLISKYDIYQDCACIALWIG